MATTDQQDGGTDASSAREFAERRLKEAAEEFTPSELADEYGCGNGHMRHCLRDLLDSGTVERIERGVYAHGDAEIETNSGTEDGGEFPSEETQLPAPAVDTDDTEEDCPSADGGPRSRDTDTEESGDTEIVDGDDLDDLDESSMVSTERAAGAAAAGGAGLLAVSDWDTQKWVLVGLAVGAVAYLWWRSRSSTSDQRNQQDEYGGELDGYDGELSEDDFNHLLGDPAGWAR